MKPKTDWSRLSLWLLLASALIIIGLAYPRIWKQGATIRGLEAKLGEKEADLAEALGDIADMRGENNYFKMYSFQIVMGVLIKKARQYQIPINVALALAQIESAFNPFAISSTGDWGLLQINEWSHKFDKQKIFEPEYNINLGLAYLRKCHDQAGSWAMALALYNAGKNYERSEHPRKLAESKFMEK